jgi:hypothetical protein
MPSYIPEKRSGVMPLWKRLVIISVAGGVGVALTFALIVGGLIWFQSLPKPPKAWNERAIRASYVDTIVEQTDRGNAALVFYYDIQNDTDFDYRLDDSSSIVIMQELGTESSLSAEKHIKLEYPVFVPAKHRARIALSLSHAFEWPDETDPAFQKKVSGFVKRRLADVEGFVLFDETRRYQINFPKGWGDLLDPATTGN